MIARVGVEVAVRVADRVALEKAAEARAVGARAEVVELRRGIEGASGVAEGLRRSIRRATGRRAGRTQGRAGRGEQEAERVEAIGGRDRARAVGERADRALEIQVIDVLGTARGQVDRIVGVRTVDVLCDAGTVLEVGDTIAVVVGDRERRRAEVLLEDAAAGGVATRLSRERAYRKGRARVA